MADQNDIFSALTGGAPTDPQKQMALAQTLREKDLMGRLGQMSGDRVLGPMGQQMQAGAMSGAQDIATEREKQQQEATQQQYRDAQQANWQQARLDEQAKNKADIASREKVAGMLVGGRQDVTDATTQRDLAIQAMKDADAKLKATQGKPLPASIVQELGKYQDSLNGVNQAIATYQPGFGGAGRAALNSLATSPLNSLMPDSAKDAQNWWANYGRQFTLPEVHAQFGARLTQPEMDKFAAVHLNENMSDKQIQTNLPQIQGQLSNKLTTRIQELRDGGYNPGYLDSVEAAVRAGTGQAGPGAAPTAAGNPYVAAAKAKLAGAQAPTQQAPAQPGPQQPPSALPASAGQQRPPMVDPRQMSVQNMYQGVMGGQ